MSEFGIRPDEIWSDGETTVGRDDENPETAVGQIVDDQGNPHRNAAEQSEEELRNSKSKTEKKD
jgi:hypothetical protein